MDTLITRHPVFDRREQLFGYDLVLRRPGRSGVGSGAASQQLETDTILGIGVDQVAAGHPAFVTVDRAMLFAGAARSLPPDRVILQIRPGPGSDREFREWTHACGDLVRSGYRIAIATNRPHELPDVLLRLAHIVMIDIAGVDRGKLSDVVARLRGFDVRLLATRVRHRIERDICTNLGFELFEGYGFAGPARLTRQDLPLEHIQIFRLLRMVHDLNATDSEIEDTLRRDVALSYKLFRTVNSGAVGGRDVWSISQALRLLGRDQVARWLLLLLVTDSARGGVRAELATLALVRARMCELVADTAGAPRARAPMFLLGMSSVLDQLLETPLEIIADAIELAPDIRAALLRREDEYGVMLDLVDAYEQGTWERVDSLARSVGIGTKVLLPLYLESLAWANEHQRSREVTRPAVRPSDRPELRVDSERSTRVARLR
jgi:EAL and modified HD-GYP domain-containing signal transduction protein